ncbi:MAG: hypothetical protein AAFR87_29675 [Bacteroidota bacterium]
MLVQRKRILRMLAGIGGLLLIPLIAMQFTEEVNWQVGDFLIMGTVLLGLGLLYEFIARRSEKPVYKAAFALGLLGAFLLFWVNGAVGIIGNEGQDVNLLFGVVYVVGLIGALISRFKAKGMSITLFVAAALQMLVPIVAYFLWSPPETSWSPGVLGVFIISGFFATLFFISGFLFRQSVQD